MVSSNSISNMPATFIFYFKIAKFLCSRSYLCLPFLIILYPKSCLYEKCKISCTLSQKYQIFNENGNKILINTLTKRILYFT